MGYNLQEGPAGDEQRLLDRTVNDPEWRAAEKRRREQAAEREASKPHDAAGLLEALLKDIVDDGAYNALGTGLVERLLEIKAAL